MTCDTTCDTSAVSGSTVTSRALYDWINVTYNYTLDEIIDDIVHPYYIIYDEILRWLEVFYYTSAGGDRKAIIPTY